MKLFLLFPLLLQAQFDTTVRNLSLINDIKPTVDQQSIIGDATHRLNSFFTSAANVYGTLLIRSPFGLFVMQSGTSAFINNGSSWFWDVDQLYTTDNARNIGSSSANPATIYGHAAIFGTSTGSGQNVNIGINSINATRTPGGNLIWAIGQAGGAGKGIFRVFDGSGTGGFDGVGAKFLMDEAGSFGPADTLYTVNLNVTGTCTGCTFAFTNLNPPADNTYTVGTGTARWSDVFGTTMHVGTNAAHQTAIASDSINAATTPGGNLIWALGQAGGAGKGILRVFTGTGSGEVDSVGGWFVVDTAGNFGTAKTVYGNNFNTGTTILSSAGLAPTSDLGMSIGDGTHRVFFVDAYQIVATNQLTVGGIDGISHTTTHPCTGTQVFTLGVLTSVTGSC